MVTTVALGVLQKAEQTILRVFLGESSLSELLGKGPSTFTSHKIDLSKTKICDIRTEVLKQLAKGLSEHTKRELIMLVRDERYCIVEVSKDGSAVKLPPTSLVSSVLDRHQRETRERLMRQTRRARAASRERAGSIAPLPGSKAADFLGTENNLKKSTGSSIIKALRPRSKSRGASSKKRINAVAIENKAGSVIKDRKQLEKLELQTQSVLVSQMEEVSEKWNPNNPGDFKLIARVHCVESIDKYDQVLASFNYGDLTKKTPQRPVNSPEWDHKFELRIAESLNHIPLTVNLLGCKDGSLPDFIGSASIELNFLQPDCFKKAWFVLKNTKSSSSSSSALDANNPPRILITLERHQAIIKNDKQLFFKAAPKSWLEISVKYPQLRLKTGQSTTIEALVRDQRNDFKPTDNLRGGTLQLRIIPSQVQTGSNKITLIDAVNTNKTGVFAFKFKPTDPGNFNATITYNGNSVQRKMALIRIRGKSKNKVSLGI